MQRAAPAPACAAAPPPRAAAAFATTRAPLSARRLPRCRAADPEAAEGAPPAPDTAAAPDAAAAAADARGPMPAAASVELDLDRSVTRFARSAATTFAPRASGKTPNPAQPGTLLYDIFGYQAWLALFVGGLASFNLIFPSDKPDIARLLGMWSVWMFTVPSLRARECTPAEKDALNLLFLAIPVANVAIPFVAKDFGLIFAADCVLLAGVYAWKGLLPGMVAAAEEEPRP